MGMVVQINYIVLLVLIAVLVVTLIRTGLVHHGGAIALAIIGTVVVIFADAFLLIKLGSRYDARAAQEKAGAAGATIRGETPVTPSPAPVQPPSPGQIPYQPESQIDL